MAAVGTIAAADAAAAGPLPVLFPTTGAELIPPDNFAMVFPGVYR